MATRTDTPLASRWRAWMIICFLVIMLGAPTVEASGEESLRGPPSRVTAAPFLGVFGLVNAILFCWMMRGRLDELGRRQSFILFLSNLEIIPLEYLRPFLAEGGSLEGGPGEFWDWLIDNYQALEFARVRGEREEEEQWEERVFGGRWDL
jgi:hypothetical protein